MNNEIQILISQSIEILPKLAIVIIVGGVLGFERQRRGKSIGILTAILVAMGSMIFVHASLLFTQQTGVVGDEARIASMIISGIGFIGAGAIMRSKFSITGMASAATIWNLGGLGIIIGFGYELLGLVIGVIVFLLLRLIPILEHVLFNERFCMHVDLEVKNENLAEIIDFLIHQQISFSEANITRNEETSVIAINECGMESRTGIMDSLRHLDGIINILDHH